MLGDISGLERIYIVCGYTDMRKSIDNLEVLDAPLTAAIGKMPGPSGKTVRRAVHGWSPHDGLLMPSC